VAETNDVAKANGREVELAHFQGRLYKHGRELLARDPERWLIPEELELELAKYAGMRDADRPKWLNEPDADAPIRAAAELARGDFKDEANGTATGIAGAGAGAQATELPIINRYGRRLRELVDDGLDSLARLNQAGPQVFDRAGALARIKWIDGAAQIEIFDPDSLVLTLDRAANWIKDDGAKQQKTEPPERVVRSMLKMARYQFPSLRGIANAPFFASDGRLVAALGYDPASGIFLDPAGLTLSGQRELPGMGGAHRGSQTAVLDAIPERPSAEYVRMAVTYLSGELLADFPFATPADHANAIGLLLTPFVRPMVEGPVPLHVIDSPQVGTGKSLLASVVHIIATGRNAPTGFERFERSEAGKAITAMLLEAPPIILLDNVSRHLMSGAFAAALTADTWTDRVLGASRMVKVENRAVWIATGNNLTLSSELRRRSVEIRLDAKMERPDERASFRHPDLKQWARGNRAALAHSALTLIQNWIALGQPPAPGKPLASFEGWWRVIGGILAAAGSEGFLANTERFRERADPDAKNWRRFIGEWAKQHGESPVTVSDLMAIAQGLIPESLGSGTERSQHTRLGRALTKREGQIFAGWRIEGAECRDADGRARNGFRLARATC